MRLQVHRTECRTVHSPPPGPGLSRTTRHHRSTVDEGDLARDAHELGVEGGVADGLAVLPQSVTSERAAAGRSRVRIKGQNIGRIAKYVQNLDCSWKCRYNAGGLSGGSKQFRKLVKVGGVFLPRKRVLDESTRPTGGKLYERGRNLRMRSRSIHVVHYHPSRRAAKWNLKRVTSLFDLRHSRQGSPLLLLFVVQCTHLSVSNPSRKSPHLLAVVCTAPIPPARANTAS